MPTLLSRSILELALVIDHFLNSMISATSKAKAHGDRLFDLALHSRIQAYSWLYRSVSAKSQPVEPGMHKYSL